jgi:hypothetical protein
MDKIPFTSNIMDKYSKWIAIEDMKIEGQRIEILEYSTSMKTRKSKLVN